MDIAWSDEHRSHYDFAYLREQCPCATCDDERRKKQHTVAAGPELPMFKPRMAARAAKPVGSYALQFEFTDGHSTGIFSYDYLRSICPCGRCAT